MIRHQIFLVCDDGDCGAIYGPEWAKTEPVVVVDAVAHGWHVKISEGKPTATYCPSCAELPGRKAA